MRRHVRLLLTAVASALAGACAATAAGPADAPGAAGAPGEPSAPSAPPVVNLTPAEVSVDAQPNAFTAAAAQFSAAAFGHDSMIAANAPLWATDDSAVARVSQRGLLVGVRAGRTTVRATVRDSSATAVVNVVSPSATRVLVIAHRGFRLWYPENTTVAISNSLDIGADGVEIDVRLSRDDVPFVMHDETVDRTTNGTGKVREMTAAQLSALNACAKAAGKWPPCALPTLAEALAVARGRGVMLLHLYGPYTSADLARMLGLVRGAGMEGRVVVICFDYPTLRLVRALDASVPLGFLSTALPSLDSVAALGRAAAMPELQAAQAVSAKTQQYIVDARARGLDAAGWVVYTDADAQAAVALGFRRLLADAPVARPTVTP